jgi:hypothetical protein
MFTRQTLTAYKDKKTGTAYWQCLFPQGRFFTHPIYSGTAFDGMSHPGSKASLQHAEYTVP